ncbi:LysR family transcriptional regulator [Microvirga puerhi]|uniref:LysR family transcriptional regulator n=1 Tax=Microvirga puerhi TaxID=2876078 RepID=A0ABS7VUB5_9HYPH|nr:LysR family transcriptional regulator [Microvirga puerhi]MBZ6078774.1 LysR family transcriptional regulator [Microvirga puerhi]
MFDWNDLRHFVALADDGSLSAAARRLGVEHATVARRVAALEAAVGAKLVDRRGGRYVLTGDGESVAHYARRMEAEAFAVERVLHARQQEIAVEISVSAPPVFATLLIAPRLPLLKQSHPRLRLRLLGQNRTVSLPRREADLALRLVRPNDPSLVARKAGSVSYGLYASRAYLTARAAEDYEFIAFDESLDDVPQQTWLKTMAGSRPIVFRTNDLSIQGAAAQAHAGVAALPAFQAEALGLVRAGPNGPSFFRDVWLTYHEDLRGNAAVAAVAAFLADCVQQPAREA